MPKTPAERVRECNARKKLLKQPKPPAQTAAQRSRAYRVRKKAMKNAATAIAENKTPPTSFFGSCELHTLNPDSPQPSTSRNDGNILYNYLSETSGQAGQAHVPVENAEEKIIVVKADVYQTNYSSQCVPNPTSRTTTKIRESCVRRSREYRKRKKAMKDANAILVQRPLIFPFINVSSNVTDIQVDPVLQSETMEVECYVPATSVIRRQWQAVGTSKGRVLKPNV